MELLGLNWRCNNQAKISAWAPIYQNYDAKGYRSLKIKNLSQLTSLVRWTQSSINTLMIRRFLLNVVQEGSSRLVKINRDSEVHHYKAL